MVPYISHGFRKNTIVQELKEVFLFFAAVISLVFSKYKALSNNVVQT